MSRHDAIVSIAALAVAATLHETAAAQATARASVATGGAQSNAHSSDILQNRSAISGDGALCAFESPASNLVAGDTNGTGDIFVRDFASGVTTRVSVSSSGAQAPQQSQAPEITADGRFVLFTSNSQGLVAADTNFSEDVYVHDRANGTTALVSVSTSGSAAGLCWMPAFTSPYRRPLSSDGRFVAFTSSASNVVAGDTNNAPDVFLRDMQIATTARISLDSLGAQAAGSSVAPSMTGDARFVAFESNAALVAADTNGFYDVYVVERLTGAVERVSTSVSGAQATGLSFDASISDDARFVAFQSAAANLVAGDTNGVNDVFVKTRASGAIVRANVRSDGTQPTVTADGPVLSRDGRCVAFWSWDPMLVAGDNNGVPDVFVRDLLLGTNRRVSLGASGVEADGSSFFPDLSSNGLHASFSSGATNLVPGDTNNKFDVFVRDAAAAGPAVFCVAKLNSQGCTPRIAFAGSPSISGPLFTIGATQVLNQKNGLLFYGPGAAAAPFMGGTRCVKLPVKRMALANSLGNAPPDDCSGSYSFDMRAWIVSGADPSLVPGARVAAQYWSRDPASSHGVGLTDAVAFVITP